MDYRGGGGGGGAKGMSLKLGDYLSVQAHKPCSISH